MSSPTPPVRLTPMPGTSPVSAAASPALEPEVEEPGMSDVAIVLSVLMFPFLLVVAALLLVLWIMLLPFRPWMHEHPASATERPSNTTLVQTALPDGADQGSFFQSIDNQLWLFHRSWMPTQPFAGVRPRGLVFVAHGFGEHCSRKQYSMLAASLTSAGFAVCAMDHQGHGRSTGERAFYTSIDSVVADYIQFIGFRTREIQARTGGAPIPRFIYGHSMGGLIALMAACEISNPANRERYQSIQVQGVILSSPCLMIDPKLATPTLKGAAMILSGILPKLVLKGLPPTYLSRNKRAVYEYTHDPLVWMIGARTRVGAEMLAGIDRVLPQLSTFTLPILLLHGTADVVVPLGASTKVYNRVASEDKQFLRYAGGFHELTEDDEHGEQWLRDIREWALDHSAPPGSAIGFFETASSPAPVSAAASVPEAVSPMAQNGVLFHVDGDQV